MTTAYTNARPTQPGYYWHRCADRRTTEKIVLVTDEVLASWRLWHGHSTKVHACRLCEFAGPIELPGTHSEQRIDSAIKTLTDLRDRDGGPDWIKARDMVRPDVDLAIDHLRGPSK